MPTGNSDIAANSLGSKVVYGTALKDSVTFSLVNDPNADAISTGDGSDVVTVVNGTSASVQGAAAKDKLSVWLGDGNDTFTSNATMNTLVLDAGTGNDVMKIGGMISSATISAGTGDDSVNYTAYGKEAMLDGGAGNDTIYATSVGHKAIYGGDGNDSITFALQNDVVTDAINGGAGNDTVTVVPLNFSNGEGIWQDKLIVGLGDGDDLFKIQGVSMTSLNLDAGAGNDTVDLDSSLRITDATVIGGEGNDSINASGGVNAYVDAGNGNDTINADSKGHDALYGGAGNDYITFNLANDGTTDAISGDAGNDTVSVSGYAGLNAQDKLIVSLGDGDDGFTNNGNLKSLSLDAGAGNDTMTIFGNVHAATISGGDGNDIIAGVGTVGGLVDGGTGNDTITANEYGNVVYGGSGNDSITTFSLGVQNASMSGAAQQDALKADTIYGGDGNDTLVAGKGNDQFTGGVGADLFVVSPLANAGNTDTITDFVHMQDHIKLTGGLEFSDLTITNVSSGGGTASNFTSSSGALITVNGHGTSGSVYLTGVDAHTLTASDFMFS